MITRRSFLASAATPLFARSNPPLNVLFIAADDMNTGLACYGHPFVKSPNVDRLAARGVRFDRAYCQFPLCGPTRASLLTGMRPDTTQVLGNNIDFRQLHPNAVTLPQLFKNNGWFAAREGKMFHMNVPGEVTLPRFQDEPSWNHSSSPGGLEGKSPGERRRTTPPDVGFGMEWISTTSAAGQSDTQAADRALALLEQRKAAPFFLAVGFLRPHAPFVAPSRFFDLYPLDRVPLPKNPPDDLDDIPAAAKAVRPMTWNNMKMDERGQREIIRAYWASTSFMDDQCGRVLAGLEKMGLAGNTVVVFWGDHGYNLGEHTRWQKMSLFEESTRVPLIVAAPGRKGNGKPSRALVEFVDIYPTLAQLCGLTPPSALEGQSLVPLLENPSRSFKKAAFSQLTYEKITGRSIRTVRYRYTRWEGEGGGEELYDHDKDAREFTNLALNSGARPIVEEHRRILDAGWRAARAAKML